ncbi:MAG: VCBS repeat-containing protein [Saprospiraceae bacterium]|nr:VCBS repeat-containing protein [Saprospiraceae bacterium]
MKFYLIVLVFLSLPVLAQNTFTDIAPSSGIYHIYSDVSPTGGVSFSDFNQDGWDDLTFSSDKDSLIQFYLNQEGVFQKVDLGIDNRETVMQILWVDYDNDGDKDLYVNAYEGVNRLYQNQGLLQFLDVTTESGLPEERYLSYGACWGDYDRDGWLDLYVQERKGPQLAAENRNRLYRNNTNGTFSEVTDLTNTAVVGRKPFCASFSDFNNDMWPDIYIANDKLSVNTLLINQKDGTFFDASSSAGADLEMNAMCVTIGDYDANGWQDIYITNTEEGNKLLRNLGPSGSTGIEFEEVAVSTGTEFNGIGWGSSFLDSDNDGDLDLYVCGMDIGIDAVTSALYRNNGSGNFTKLPAFLGDTVVSHSNALGDVNNDGYPDIVVSNFSPFPAQIWQNSGGDQHWLKVRLTGVISNREGIGSRIEVYSGDNYQVRYTYCGIGFLGQNSDTEIFGVGNAILIDSIRITWPTGHQDKFYELAPDQKLSIIEGSSTNGEIRIDPEIEQTTARRNFDLQSVVVDLFPNPGADHIHIGHNAEGPVNVEVRSLSGKLIFEEKSLTQPVIRLNTETWIPGTYLIRIQNQQKQSALRLWYKQ